MTGKKLLVADDSLTIQKVIRLALSNEGYDIQAISDGNDAIQQISIFRPDIILIDVSLPGQSAVEVKRAVQQHSDLADVRFVLMSSAFEKVDERQVAEVQFHGRLTKPFDPAHLRQVLNDVLAQPVSPSSHASTMAPDKEPDFSISSISGLKDFSEQTDPGIPDLPPALRDNLPSSEFEPLEITPAPNEVLHDIWDKEPAPNKPEGEGDNDIRQLTESTIRMSGLDDFQWSVNEPSLKPPGSLTDIGGSSFPLDTPPPPPSFPPFPPLPNALPPQAEEIQLSGPGLEPPAPPAAAIAKPAPAGASVSGLSQQQLEELIEQQVGKVLRKMAQSMLPEVAERIIKEEIRRLLSEQP